MRKGLRPLDLFMALAAVALVPGAVSSCARNAARSVPDAGPAEPPEFIRLELMDESPHMMPHVSEIAGKHLQGVLTGAEINRVFVLKNRTSAMSDVHLANLRRLIDVNPVIAPMWEKDKDGALRLVRDVDRQRQFFSAIVEKKDGTFVGVLMSSERVRIVTPRGAGIVERKLKPSKPSEATR